MRGNMMKRLLCVMLVIAMLAAHTLPVYAVGDAKVTFTQVDNSAVSAVVSDREPAERKEEEPTYADTDMVRVSIVLEKAGTIAAGYAVADIAKNQSAMNYRGTVADLQKKIVNKIERSIGAELDVVWNLTLAANIISANVAYGQIGRIEGIPGVRRVFLETCYEPDVFSTGAADPNMATSGAQIGSAAVWGAGYTGAGSKIAIIDTGIDVEHEAFDPNAFDYSLSQMDGTCDLMDADETASVLTQLNAYKRSRFSAQDFYFNSKIPFGFNYLDGDLDIIHLNDGNGEHGSHVAGIAAANAYVRDSNGTYAAALDTTYVQGVAPDAQLMVMKVFGKGGGAYDSDYMAAIEDALILGADSINLSLGSSNPGMSRNDGYSDEVGYYQNLLDMLEKSGVVVAMSAGNSGHWAESAENGAGFLYRDDVSFHTNGSPGSYTNAFTVASVDNSGFTAEYLNVGGNLVSYVENLDYGNAPISTLAGTREYVFVYGVGTPEEFAAVGRDVLDGKIVMCYRGELNFADKANAAAAMGAAGVIIVNNVEGTFGMNLTGYQYSAPCVSISLADGEYFKAAGTQHSTGTGMTYWTGTVEVSDGMGAGQLGNAFYTMSSFSSWGVPGSLELKPEITAPGGSIYSVAGAANNWGELLYMDHASYEVMSGTSMASPQVAGMAALMAQYIRESGLDQVTGLDQRTLAQSLLMSTAVPLRDSASGGNYYPVIQQGAGLANVGAAANADSYILMGSNATASYRDGKVKAELGDDPEKTGVYSFTFTIHNLTDKENTFALAADVFTQDTFENEGIAWLDTWTRNLAPVVSWTVDGMPAEGGTSMEGMDFNGDGAVNAADGQILLDYATGLAVTLHNTDIADLNSDGVINSYDSYRFFDLLGTVSPNGGPTATVAPNGSAEVMVTITLNGEDREWLENYENGAYIEAFVYAESLTSEEGKTGTIHSIPVLAYYGSWSDPSMFDKGSYVEFMHGLENRPPYLYGSNYAQGYCNTLRIVYGDDPGKEYDFGGNPFVPDDTYMPERNAISTYNSDMIGTIGFAAIRNAAAGYFRVVDRQTGEVYYSEDLGPVYSAYYFTNGGSWENTYYEYTGGYNPVSLAEGTAVDVGITLVPEYYVDEYGNVDWDALGEGTTFSMPMVVDSQRPVLNDVRIFEDDDILKVTATDNQYIAAVALFDRYGEHLYTSSGSDPDQAAGDTVTFDLDLSDVNGTGFLLQVFDYAGNVITYQLDTQIGDVVDWVEGIELSQGYVSVQLGSTYQMVATVYPLNSSNRDVIWSTSDEGIVSVDENGCLTANAVGSAIVAARCVADQTISASCTVEVVDLSARLNGIVWDEQGSIWFSSFKTNELPNYEKLSHDMLVDDYFTCAAMGDDGTLYASTLDLSNYTSALYTVDPDTYAVSKLSDCVINGMPIFFADLTYVPAMYGTGALLGIYGPYVLSIDPDTGEILDVVDELDCNLVGITTTFSEYDPNTNEYMDGVYLIQNDGTIIHEYYYGYDGWVAPFNPNNQGYRDSFNCGISVNDANFFNSAFYDGENLYWSAFDVDTQNEVTLYAIDVTASSTVHNMGQFPYGVWPVGGLYQRDYIYEVNSSISLEVPDRAIQPAEIQLVAQEFPVKEIRAAGSLNSMTGSAPVVRPMADASVNDSETHLSITLTAGDITDAAQIVTNGVATVDYDAAALELVDIQIGTDYTSVNAGDGCVTFGFVDLKGLTPEDTVAVLVFEIKNTDTASITVTGLEANDSTEDYESIIQLELKDQTDIIYGDSNGDGIVNSLDVIRLRQYLADWDVQIDSTASDANGDGNVNSLDVIRLRQYLADWDVTLGP